MFGGASSAYVACIVSMMISEAFKTIYPEHHDKFITFVDDMVWIAFDETCNVIFQNLTKVISYFGMTIGDYSKSTITCQSLTNIHQKVRYAGATVISAIGFALDLTLPRPTFNISGWKRSDLIACLEVLVCIGVGKSTVLSLENAYRIVGRIIWVRVNSFAYVPNVGPLAFAQIVMAASNDRAWEISHGSAIWHSCRKLLKFVRQDWPLVMPEIILPKHKVAIYCDAPRLTAGRA